MKPKDGLSLLETFLSKLRYIMATSQLQYEFRGVSTCYEVSETFSLIPTSNLINFNVTNFSVPLMLEPSESIFPKLSRWENMSFNLDIIGKWKYFTCL